jgi:molybdopterin-guanine dinucleotide biosynthesis protein MobB
MGRGSIPLISIAGSSNTGKTTLIELLIPLFKARGLRIATIKHHHRDFNIDIPGKDTFRHKEAGAATTIIAGSGKIALVADLPEELSLSEIVSRYVRDVDIIIVEGFKKEKIPKIEVFRKTGAAEGPVCLADPELLALVTDEEIAAAVPVFRTDEISGLAEFILSRIL